MNNYNVHICIKSELKDLQQFINDHWKKNHILATSQKLMDWQHYNKENETYNFVLGHEPIIFSVTIYQWVTLQ